MNDLNRKDNTLFEAWKESQTLQVSDEINCVKIKWTIIKYILIDNRIHVKTRIKFLSPHIFTDVDEFSPI